MVKRHGSPEQRSTGGPQKRITLVHLAKSRLGLSDDEYRGALEAHGGVSTARDLTPAGFDRLMAHFRTCGFVSDARRALVANRPERGTSSQAQIDLITALWREVSTEPSIRKLEAWMERQHGISALRFVNAAKARKIIGALRLWKRRQATAPQAPEEAASASTLGDVPIEPAPAS